MNSTPLCPLLSSAHPVDWWLAFKFNGATYPCSESLEPPQGIFGGLPQDYGGGLSLNYAIASSDIPSLQMGTGYLGTSLNDPLGATFNQIYQGICNYVIWNDQFKGDPLQDLAAPWGHSKGVLAWDNTGAGFVIQVSTPSWPASGSPQHPRKSDGNTLGCVKDDDVMLSQHFFALKLTPADVAVVLRSLANAQVGTDPKNQQIVSAADLLALVNALGAEPKGATVMKQTLSSDIVLISKPSALAVPPWQLISSELGAIPLRVACFWGESPVINSTTAATPVTCWAASLSKPGAVQIATSGTWQGKSIGLMGGEDNTCNHGKIGVCQSANLCIFGDMNQQGSLGGPGQSCSSAQNGRGGLFYVLNQATLANDLTALLKGDTAPNA